MPELTPAESHRVFSEAIEPALFSTVTTRHHPRPRAIVLGGQPGAGKSSSLRYPVQSELKSDGGAVVIDADQMRTYHPQWGELSREDDLTAAALTHPDAARWVNQAVDATTREQCHVVLDGTMGSADSAIERLQRFVGDGYEVEVRILAVDAKTSWLGVLRRYEEAKARVGSGRMTPREVHDEAYDGLKRTLERIQTDLPDVRIRIYDRGGILLFDSKNPNGAVPGAVNALRRERDRPWTEVEREQFRQGVDRVVELAQTRGADAATIEAYRALRR